MLRRKTKIFHCQVILKYIQLFLYSRLLLMFLQFKIMFQPPCTHYNILWLFFFYPKCYYWIWQILLLLAFIQHPLSHHQKGITQHKDCCVTQCLPMVLSKLQIQLFIIFPYHFNVFRICGNVIDFTYIGFCILTSDSVNSFIS